MRSESVAKLATALQTTERVIRRDWARYDPRDAPSKLGKSLEIKTKKSQPIHVSPYELESDERREVRNFVHDAAAMLRDERLQTIYAAATRLVAEHLHELNPQAYPDPDKSGVPRVILEPPK